MLQVQSWLQASNDEGRHLTVVPIMVNEIRTSDHRGLSKGRGSKFCISALVWQETLEETLEEGRRTHRPKRCEYNNGDSSPKTLNAKFYLRKSGKQFEMNFHPASLWQKFLVSFILSQFYFQSIFLFLPFFYRIRSLTIRQ